MFCKKYFNAFFLYTCLSLFGNDLPCLEPNSEIGNDLPYLEPSLELGNDLPCLEPSLELGNDLPCLESGCAIENDLPCLGYCNCKINPYASCTFGRGRGYEKGYQSLGFVGGISDLNKLHFFFLDCQFLYIGQRCFGSNAGIGWRKVLAQDCDGFEGLGLNIFLDFRDIPEHPLQQLGAGFEYFGRYFNFFINGYFPIGRQRIVRNSYTVDYGDGYIAQMQDCYTAMYGLDFEMNAFYSVSPKLAFFAGIGPYYYDTFGNDNGLYSLLGGMARLGTHLFSIFDCELSFTYDRIFKGCTQFQISASCPLSCIQPLFYLSSVSRNPILIKTSSCRYQTNF